MTNSDQLTVPQLVELRAVQEPSGLVLQHVNGGELTWSELHEESLIRADAMERLGIKSGEAVVTMFPNSFDAVLSWLGCAWLKAVEAPINTMYRGAWLTHAINLSGARLIMVHDRFLSQIIEVARELPNVETIVVFGAENAISQDLPFRIITAAEFLNGAKSTDRPTPGPWDLAGLIYTSGTTGSSKAVMIPWGQLSDSAKIDAGVERPEKIITYCPYQPYHITGKGPIIGAAYYNGRAVLRDGFSTTEFWNDINSYGCNEMALMGPIAQFLMSQPERPEDSANSLQIILMAPVIPEVEAFQKRFGVKVVTGYSMTELNMPVISGATPVTSRNFRTCGRPREGVEIRLVDEHDMEVPKNTPGEMIVRCEPWTLNLGYWNMPEKTVEAWRNGWFHTGDVFTCDEEGNLYFIDRGKDYIRRRGENISSFEVEACVNSHPDIAESAAVAVPSDQGEDEIKIVVVMKPGKAFDPAGLIEFLIPRMPRFAIPRYIEAVEELVKTQATFRIQKVKIREAGIGVRTWDRVEAGIELPKTIRSKKTEN